MKGLGPKGLNKASSVCDTTEMKQSASHMIPSPLWSPAAESYVMLHQGLQPSLTHYDDEEAAVGAGLPL